MKIEKLSDHWRVTDKQGTTYYFGQDNSSREYDPGNSLRIFKWLLSRIEDVHGNYMTLSYQRDCNKLYPLRIEYTGHGPSSKNPFAKVEFELEDRPDVGITYIPGFKVETAKRVKNIRMFVNGALQRRYALTYELSAPTNRSTLDQVMMYGSDDVSSLPPLSFSYINELPAGFSETAELR
jgi:hypothetical protein